MKLQDILGTAYKEGMTVEEIESALESVTPPEDLSGEVERLKAAVSKSNSEAANYKKQLNAKLTEDELAKQQEAEEREKLKKAYDELLRENTISKQTAKFIGLGYDEALAKETAEAFANNDFEKVFANQAIFQESYEKKIRADVLKDTPRPSVGTGADPNVKDYDKMIADAQAKGSYAEAAYYMRLQQEENNN